MYLCSFLFIGYIFILKASDFYPNIEITHEEVCQYFTEKKTKASVFAIRSRDFLAHQAIIIQNKLN
ncbi:hypothetical protein B0A79_15880 [Flavobacterium piscis]|uniref:Uncharacterized protein n=1 Tax=Flavobacterium piscis TaxID=1114874 RepID=A0ABX2XPT1_9FLAO|nr:hypothetical protein FLP_00815 [Flavobacterium piscis]OXG02418.1 hypothetical protein B0A79_15880 [Flavobacterium piscis]